MQSSTIITNIFPILCVIFKCWNILFAIKLSTDNQISINLKTIILKLFVFFMAPAWNRNNSVLCKENSLHVKMLKKHNFRIIPEFFHIFPYLEMFCHVLEI